MGRRKPEPALYVEPRRTSDGRVIHACAICGRNEPWGPDWAWFGSYKEFEEGRPVLKWCSDDCASLLALNGHYEAAEAFATSVPLDDDA
jgi:hypothetical protein